MKRIITILLSTICLFLTINSVEAKSVSFNSAWKFRLNDNTNWENINLPHDWALEGEYSVHGGQKDKGGYKMGGIGYYKKDFTLNANDLQVGKNYFIDFEGVYMNSEVWINGEYLGKRPYGYISFSYELTKFLKVGENLIEVKVDNSLEPSARWYHGCGIYGNVYLRIKENAYFEKDGTFIQTPNIANDKAEVNISTEISSRVNSEAELSYEIYDPLGELAVKGKLEDINLNIDTKSVNINSEVANPQLWSPESPSLYTLHLKMKDNKGNEDDLTIDFGFRTIEWFAETGFHLNGKQYKLQGVCEHMEGGPTGALSPDAVLRWKLKLIKDMGCNAIRVAHNPYLPSFYKMCDEIGLLVMDEIFDGWNKKADFDYGMQAFAQWWDKDIRSWIRRNRNHPSIFLYSVGNETHGDIAPKLVAECHKYDPSRLVTSGDCNPDDMDVYGVNGRSEKIAGFIEKWDMRKPFIATENPHTWQVRGFYRTQTWYRDGYPNTKQEPQYVPNLTEKEIFAYDWTAPENRRSRKQVFNSSYDNAFVRVTARHLIEILRDKPWFSGSFRWTGFDYLGEAGYVHGGWPFRAFQSGALDLAGFEKDLYYLYQSEWSDKDMVHLLPHWTHPMMEKGTEIPVWAYTTGDEVELFLNGKSLGRRQKGLKWNEMQCEWLVPWTEGKLEAVAYRDGKEIARTVQESAGAPTKLNITKYEDRDMISNANDVIILTIEQQDSKGVLYPYGENRVYNKVYGDAKVLSFENGSPVDVEPNYNASSRECFFGLNRLFIQSTAPYRSRLSSVVIAAINGDKKLMLSDLVSISVDEILLGAKRKKALKLSVRYTTDGSEPTINSPLYKEPFSVKLGTIVKATVYDGNKPIIQMEEHFTKEDGLYWGTAGEEVCAFDGNQAEYATLDQAQRSKKTGDGFFAEGYVLIKKKGGSVSFYQENDGDEYDASISIRYSQQTKDGSLTKMEMWNNDELIKTIEFKNSGSPTSHWREYFHKIHIKRGANNIKFKSITDEAPAIDQITIIQ